MGPSPSSLQSLKEEHAKLAKRMSKMHVKYRSMASEIHDTQARLETCRAQAKLVPSLKKKLKDAESEAERARSRVDKSSAVITALRKDIAEARSRTQQTLEALHTSSMATKALEEKNEEMAQVLHELQSSSESQTAVIESLRQELNTAAKLHQSEKTVLMTQNAALRGGVSNLADSQGQLADACALLQESKEGILARLSKMKDRVDESMHLAARSAKRADAAVRSAKRALVAKSKSDARAEEAAEEANASARALRQIEAQQIRAQAKSRSIIDRYKEKLEESKEDVERAKRGAGAEREQRLKLERENERLRVSADAAMHRAKELAVKLEQLEAGQLSRAREMQSISSTKKEGWAKLRAAESQLQDIVGIHGELMEARGTLVHQQEEMAAVLETLASSGLAMRQQLEALRAEKRKLDSKLSEKVMEVEDKEKRAAGAVRTLREYEARIEEMHALAADMGAPVQTWQLQLVPLCTQCRNLPPLQMLKAEKP